MAALEHAISQTGSTQFTLQELTNHLPGFTRDQVQMGITAMVAVGAVRADGRAQFVVFPSEFDSGRDERARVRETIRWVTDHSEPPDDLLVSAPAEAKRQAPIPFERGFLDLRTAIRSLIAKAQDDLILAAPYWDLEVATDLAALIGRRLEAGVNVRVLARPARRGSATSKALSVMAEAMSGHEASYVRLLEEPSEVDRFGTATFHFKLAVADSEIAYLGSANFNTAGLASRWELGVLIHGSRARTLATVADSLFDAASPYRRR